MNKTILLGRVVRDPELRYTKENGVAVANFSIAVNRRFVKGQEQETDFFKVVAWGGTGEFVAKHFTQGQPICIEGRLHQRKWTDKSTGEPRYTVEVIAESVNFAGFKRDDAQNSDAASDDDFDPTVQDAA